MNVIPSFLFVFSSERGVAFCIVEAFFKLSFGIIHWHTKNYNVPRIKHCHKSITKEMLQHVLEIPCVT